MGKISQRELRELLIQTFCSTRDSIELKIYEGRHKDRYVILPLLIPTQNEIIEGKLEYDQEEVAFTELFYTYKEKEVVIDLTEL